MPLQRQLLQTGFRFGVDEGTEPHAVPWGTLTRAENARWVKGGRLEKRGGISALSTSIVGGGSLSSASRLVTRGNELCLVSPGAAGGQYLYSYASAYGWRNRGAVPDIGVTYRTAVDTTDGVMVSDTAAFADAGGNTLVAIAWVSGDPLSPSGGGAAYVTIQEAATGATVLAPSLLLSSGAKAIRVLYVGTTVVVVCRNGANVSAWTIPTSTFAVSGVTNLRTDAANGAVQSGFDACVIGSNFGILYNDNTAVTAVVRLYTYTAALAAVNNAPITSTNNAYLALASDGTYVYAGANLQMFSRDASTLSVVGGTATLPGDLVGICAPGGASTGSVLVSYLISGSAGGATVAGVGTVVAAYTGSVTASTKRATWGTRPITRPWTQDGRYFLVLSDDLVSPSGSFVGCNTYLVEAALTDASAYGTTVPHRYVAKLDQMIGGTWPSNNGPSGCPASVTATGTTTFYAAVPFLATAPAQNKAWRQGLRLTSFTSSSAMPADSWRSVTYANEAYLSGGVLTAYDGATCFDYGFARQPVSVSSVAAAGGSMATGTYLYGVCAEYRSKAGVLHRSTTSGFTQSAVPATGKVTIQWALCNVGSKQTLGTTYGATSTTPIYLPTFRSVVSGSTLQRLTVEPTANTTPVVLTSVAQQLVDTRADSSVDGAGTTLASRPVLYTTGGILDDVQPPALSTLTLHRLRLWGVGPDQRTIWYSKSFSDDQGVAPGFNEAFRIVAGQDVVALVSMDDKLVVLYRDGIGYIQGDGPNAAGANGDFTSVIDVQTDVGCSNPRSVVSTPFGVLFQSTRGLYLLTRGLEVVWFGRQVQDVIASYPNVTSATLVPKYSEVRFTANDAAGTSHTVLVWNYVEKQWSTFRYLSGAVGIADACVWNGTWVFVTTTGAAYSESASTYLDAGAYVSMVLETAWLSAAGPLAFQSCREMQLSGASRSNHDLLVEVAFDSSTSYAQTRTFTAGSAVTAIGSLEECTIAIGTQRKAASIRFRISDLTPTNPGTYPVGTGQGPAFDTIGVEVGIKQGFSTNPATKRG